jgi:hypothetical protein
VPLIGEDQIIRYPELDLAGTALCVRA